MPTTYLHAVASLDGYIADEHDDVGPLHDWYFNGDHPLVDDDHPDVHGLPFRVSAASADYVGLWSRQKVLVVGRHQFDLTDGWEGHPPASDTSSSYRTDEAGLAPRGVLPLRHLGGGGHGPGAGAGRRGGDRCGRG